MSNLGPEARAVLEAARNLDNPSHEDRARVRRSLFARVASGGAAILVTSSVRVAVAKTVLPIALVVAAGAGGALWWRAHRDASAVVVPPVAPAALVAAPEPSQVSTSSDPPAPAPAVSPVHRQAAPPAARATDVPAPAHRLEEETALLAEVNSALRDGNARRSLQLLDEYDRRFPSGVLREEVSATRVIADCRLSPGAGTQREARAFLRGHPASPLAPRVRESCAVLDR